MKKIAIAGTVGSLLALFTACAPSTSEIAAVQELDVPRYMGRWYEIARLPQSFERDISHVSANYTLEENGTVQVINRGMKNGKVKEIAGIAKFKNPGKFPQEGELLVSFFRPFYFDYRIIELAPDYSYAVVTGSRKDTLWILARKPEMETEQLFLILSWLQALGFETEHMDFPEQDDAGF